jgi:mycoredoxin
LLIPKRLARAYHRGMSAIQVYGTDWCEDTQHTREHLDSLGVPYDFVNIDADADARQWVIRQNDGKQKTPTVRIAGQTVLSEPSNAELDIALRKSRLIN